jgi:hypothetical protein
MKPTQFDCVQFFYEHAGYGYNPKTETPEEGRMRGAKSLAAAERLASEHGVQFEWYQDGLTNREWTDEGEEYQTWACRMIYQGETLDALGGVDFGQDGSPWGDNYARVVEAELALQFEPNESDD